MIYVGIIIGVIVLAAIIVTLYCICKKKSGTQNGNVSEPNSKYNEPGSEVTVRELKTNDNIIKKKFTFQTTAGIKKEIDIEPNKTIKDLIITFFSKIKQPKLFKDNEIHFVCDGEIIGGKKLNELVSDFCNKHNENPIFLVIDVNSKIKEPHDDLYNLLNKIN